MKHHLEIEEFIALCNRKRLENSSTWFKGTPHFPIDQVSVVSLFNALNDNTKESIICSLRLAKEGTWLAELLNRDKNASGRPYIRKTTLDSLKHRHNEPWFEDLLEEAYYLYFKKEIMPKLIQEKNITELTQYYISDKDLFSHLETIQAISKIHDSGENNFLHLLVANQSEEHLAQSLLDDKIMFFIRFTPEEESKRMLIEPNKNGEIVIDQVSNRVKEFIMHKFPELDRAKTNPVEQETARSPKKSFTETLVQNRDRIKTNTATSKDR